MSAVLNADGTPAASNDPLLALAELLMNPVDRQQYADLVWWIRHLPSDDELVKLAYYFGFITLIARQLPDALVAESRKLQDVSQTNIAYFHALQRRLERLPGEIADGINMDEFAATMSESFRQQLATTAIEDTADILKACVPNLQRVTRDLSESVKSLLNQYAAIGTTIAAELKKLTDASATLRDQNTQLVAQAAEENWLRRAVLYLAICLVGILLGMTLQTTSTTDAIADLATQVEQLQQKLSPPASAHAPQIQQRKRILK